MRESGLNKMNKLKQGSLLKLPEVPTDYFNREIYETEIKQCAFNR